jgi:hypothetical protein
LLTAPIETKSLQALHQIRIDAFPLPKGEEERRTTSFPIRHPLPLPHSDTPVIKKFQLSAIVSWLNGTAEPNPRQLEFLTKLIGDTPILL